MTNDAIKKMARDYAIRVNKNFHDRLPEIKFFGIAKEPFSGRPDTTTEAAFIAGSEANAKLLSDKIEQLERLEAIILAQRVAMENSKDFIESTAGENAELKFKLQALEAELKTTTDNAMLAGKLAADRITHLEKALAKRGEVVLENQTRMFHKAKKTVS